MTEASAQPLKWSEIHFIAQQKLAQLQKQIDIEINASRLPLPQSGGARHQFFVLLEEQANDWSLRARNVYEDSLREIGRENAPRALSQIWQHGLNFFIKENITELMRTACGMTQRDRELLSFQSSGKYQTPPDVLAARATARDIDQIVNRIVTHWEGELSHSLESWLEQSTRLLAELNQSAIPSRNPPTAPDALTAKETREPVGDAGASNESAALLKRIQHASPGECLRTAEVAKVLRISERTINRMVNDRELVEGPTRGTVTATSVKRLYESTFGKITLPASG